MWLSWNQPAIKEVKGQVIFDFNAGVGKVSDEQMKAVEEILKIIVNKRKDTVTKPNYNAADKMFATGGGSGGAHDIHYVRD